MASGVPVYNRDVARSPKWWRRQAAGCWWRSMTSTRWPTVSSSSGRTAIRRPPSGSKRLPACATLYDSTVGNAAPRGLRREDGGSHLVTSSALGATEVKGRVLEVSNVSKLYPTPRGALTVLADVSLALDAGQAAAITGPSGSGRAHCSTCSARSNRRRKAPSRSTVRIRFSCRRRRLPSSATRRLDSSFRTIACCRSAPCSKTSLVPTLVGPRSATSDSFERHARQLLGQVGLSERLDHRPAELSGGEKQRAAIARALIRRPRLMLCDEPTGNLDQASASTVASLLLDLHRQQQNVLIVVTHSEWGGAVSDQVSNRSRSPDADTIKVRRFEGSRVGRLQFDFRPDPAGHRFRCWLFLAGFLASARRASLARSRPLPAPCTFESIPSSRHSAAADGRWKARAAAVAYVVAEDNLRLGRIVIADSVNPWPLTRCVACCGDARRCACDRD